MRVVLTKEEREFARSVGLQRLAEARAKGRQGAYGVDNDAVDREKLDVEGCLCEAAAAKALGIAYEPVEGIDTDIGDIAPKVQVRGTTYRSGRLSIRKRDPDDHVYILVTGEAGSYDVRGWILAADAKLPFRHYGPLPRGVTGSSRRPSCWWIEQSELRPISELQLPV